jgi:hypothetical protein
MFGPFASGHSVILSKPPVSAKKVEITKQSQFPLQVPINQKETTKIAFK